MYLRLFLNRTLPKPDHAMTINLCKPIRKVWYSETINTEEVSNMDIKQRSPIPKIFPNNLLIQFKSVLNPKIKSVSERERTRLRYVFRRSFGVEYTTMITIKFKTIGIPPTNIRPTGTMILVKQAFSNINIRVRHVFC